MRDIVMKVEPMTVIVDWQSQTENTRPNVFDITQMLSVTLMLNVNKMFS